MNALILSSNKFTIRVISVLLEEIGFIKIDEALTCEQGMDHLNFFSYQMVISEWNDDENEGIMLLKNIKNNKTWKDTPFIVISSKNTLESVQEAQKQGVNAYIIKPFCLKTIKKKIKTMLFVVNQKKLDSEKESEKK